MRSRSSIIDAPRITGPGSFINLVSAVRYQIEKELRTEVFFFSLIDAEKMFLLTVSPTAHI